MIGGGLTELERLDDDDWCQARDEILDWVRGRPGWVRAPGALEYAPSKPPRRLAVQPPMNDPCEPTSIDLTELVVYPPSVTYRLDGTEDPDDYSSTSWRFATVPSAAEITGLDDVALDGGAVLSLRVGEDNPEQIRREIERIESWRWPDNLPQHDDPWRDLWVPGLPSDCDEIAAILRDRGWIRTDCLTDGALLTRPLPEWAYPKSGISTCTVIATNNVGGSGYWVAPPRSGSTPLSFASASQIQAALVAIETWTAKQPPRWVSRDRLLAEGDCPRCGQPSGQPCSNDPAEDMRSAVHAERLSAEAMTADGGNSLGPKPGQRPKNTHRRR